MKVLLGYGGSQYGVLGCFLDEVGNQLKLMGHEVVKCDFDQINQWELQKIRHSKIDLAINMNGIGSRFLEHIIPNQDCIIWNYFVDHPMYHLTRLYGTWDNQISSFIDKEHVKFIEQYIDNIDKVVFLPHGGIAKGTPKEYRSRNHDVVAFGTYSDINVFLQAFNNYNEQMREVLTETAIRMSVGNQSLEDCFLDELEKKGVVLEKESIPEVIEEITFVDGYVRNYNRIEMIESLGRNGIHVDLYGNGWDKYQNKYPEFIHIHPALEFNDLLDVMEDSKIILNNLPGFKNGSHERIFSAMCSGAVCVTEKNAYLANEFEDEKEVVFFEYSKIDELPEKVSRLLSDVEYAETIANNGYKRAKEHHTFKNRVEEILRIISGVENEKSIKRVKEKSQIDIKFNQIVTFVERNTKEQLYNKIKGNYYYLNRQNPEIRERMELSYKNYPYWGKLSLDENEFGLIQDRANQLKEHIDDFIWLYENLCDHTSKKVLCNVLHHWITFDLCYLQRIAGNEFEQYFDQNIIQCDSDEVLVDVGAYIGDTLLSYLGNYTSYDKIICYELDKENYKSLCNVADTFKNVIPKNYAVGEKNDWISINVQEERSSSSRISDDSMEEKENRDMIQIVSLDEDIKEKITFLKMDVEGAERLVLTGAKNHIMKEKPKLAVCIYHGNEDIWYLARLIKSMNPDYKFYIRYYGGTLYPNEIVLYAI